MILPIPKDTLVIISIYKNWFFVPLKSQPTSLSDVTLFLPHCPFIDVVRGLVYMASDIWLWTIQIVIEEARCRHMGYSFRLTARVHPTDRITHTTAFVTPVVEHWLERENVQWVHSMKDRSDDPSHHERTLLPRSNISLL